MSLFDGIVNDLMDKNPSTKASCRAVRLFGKMRDARLHAHARGCCLVARKAGPELLVYVDSALWAQEFQLNAPAILAQWNHLCAAECPSMQARSVRFNVSSRTHAAREGEDAPTDTYEPADLPALTPAEERAVEESVGVISDERLRERARAAMRSSLRWKKSNIV